MRYVVISSSELERFFDDMLAHAATKEKEAKDSNYIEKAFWRARASTLNDVREYIDYFGEDKDM